MMMCGEYKDGDAGDDKRKDAFDDKDDKKVCDQAMMDSMDAKKMGDDKCAMFMDSMMDMDMDKMQKDMDFMMMMSGDMDMSADMKRGKSKLRDMGMSSDMMGDFDM